MRADRATLDSSFLIVNPEFSPNHLVVVHYHLRPGGVRRVLEMTLPAVIAARPSVSKVTLLCGGEPAPEWISAIGRRMQGTALRVIQDAVFGYFSETERCVHELRETQRQILNSVVAEGESVLIWAHNLGLARNLPLAAEIAALAAKPGFRLVSHHHDFWFDHRWHRRAEFAVSGFSTMAKVGCAVFSGGAKVAFAVINRGDRAVLRTYHSAVRWLPNPLPQEPAVSSRSMNAAKRWMAEELNDSKPYWLFPTRFLRRKNVAESLLLTQWVRPDAWLVTTGGPSSPDEHPAYDMLLHAIRENSWRCRLGIVAEVSSCPPVSELLAASEAVVVTSLREGFGLAYFEAAIARKPLLARIIPGLMQDLRILGLRIPQAYSEIRICPTLLDVEAERTRQALRWKRWRADLPSALRPSAGRFWNFDEPVAFGRLTLEGQLEVLAKGIEKIRAVSAKWNLNLESWRQDADHQALQVATVVPTKRARLSSESFARGFWRLAASATVFPMERVVTAHTTAMAASVSPERQIPALWESGAGSD